MYRLVKDPEELAMFIESMFPSTKLCLCILRMEAAIYTAKKS